MPKLPVSILLVILLLSPICYGQQQDGSVLERRVSLNETNQPLASILDHLSWQAGVFFSYDASVISAEKQFTIHMADKSIFSVLKELFGTEKFKFNELENQIIISERIESKELKTENNDSIPVKYFFLSGKLIDNKKSTPIKYASVSIFNKPIGTISNTDGDFLLKIHPSNILDTVVISCMGYSQIVTPAYQILDEDEIVMRPISIKIREVKVTATTPEVLLENIRNHRKRNYSANSKLMTAFYRETVKQDHNNYTSVSEAVMEVLKAPYINTFRNDEIRLIKGRRSPDVKPFYWLNFKLQGGPFTITKLDVVKTMESFIDKEYQELHKYEISKVIWYNNHPVYVLRFHPISDLFFPSFVGELYVHRETYAIVHAEFYLNRAGLRKAENIMIKKKPRGVKARPVYVNYSVNYQQYQGKWHLATAQASVKFKIRSRHNKVKSDYHSISDLLVTDIKPTELKRFPRKQSFNQNDILIEMINEYDSRFWENYNIIKPDENLRNALLPNSQN